MYWSQVELLWFTAWFQHTNDFMKVADFTKILLGSTMGSRSETRKIFLLIDRRSIAPILKLPIEQLRSLIGVIRGNRYFGTRVRRLIHLMTSADVAEMRRSAKRLLCNCLKFVVQWLNLLSTLRIRPNLLVPQSRNSTNLWKLLNDLNRRG